MAHIFETSFDGNPNIGLYMFANDKFCLVGASVSENSGHLKVRVLYGTNLFSTQGTFTYVEYPSGVRVKGTSIKTSAGALIGGTGTSGLLSVDSSTASITLDAEWGLFYIV